MLLILSSCGRLVLLVFVLLYIHDWCVFEALFNLVAANFPQGIKLSNLNVDSATIWLSDMRWTLMILFPVVLSLSGTSKYWCLQTWARANKSFRNNQL